MVTLISSEEALVGLRASIDESLSALLKEPMKQQRGHGIAALPVLRQDRRGGARRREQSGRGRFILSLRRRKDRRRGVRHDAPEGRALAETLASLVVVRQPQLSEVEKVLLARLSD